MSGRLGLDVPEGEHQVILVNNSRRNFPRDDSFEKGFAHGKEKLVRLWQRVNHNLKKSVVRLEPLGAP